MPRVGSAATAPAAPPPVGLVEERVIRTRTIPPDEERPKMLSLWEYQDQMKPEDWIEHIGYLYRMQPKIAGGESYLMKFTEPITMDIIREKFGGQVFRVILKKGQQRVCDTVVTIEAPPKMQTDQQNYSQPIQPAATSDLRHALDVVADPSKVNTSIALQTAQTGFDMLRAQMAQSVAGNQLSVKDIIELMERRQTSSGMPQWLETALAAAVPALISRFLTPENPIETFKNLTSALSAIPGFGGSGAAKEDWKASLVSVLPNVFEHGTSIMREWRMATEAAARAQPALPPAGAQTAVLAAMQPNPNTPPPGTPPAGAPPPGSAPPANGPLPPPPADWLKMKLREMFLAGRTGAEVGQFLEDLAPAFLNELAPVPPETLLTYLRLDAILKTIADDPRLPEFLAQLHAWANDTSSEPAAAPAGKATP